MEAANYQQSALENFSDYFPINFYERSLLSFHEIIMMNILNVDENMPFVEKCITNYKHKNISLAPLLTVYALVSTDLLPET